MILAKQRSFDAEILLALVNKHVTSNSTPPTNQNDALGSTNQNAALGGDSSPYEQDGVIEVAEKEVYIYLLNYRKFSKFCFGDTRRTTAYF